MKTDIHPEYAETHVTCSCGNTFTTRSTAGPELSIELCNECHPFYTGTQKLVDSGGRVERFQRRYGRTSFTSETGDEAPAEAPAPVATAVEEPPAEEAGADTGSAEAEAADTEEASGAEA